ncbi:uncharacterized protein LOC143018703 [Oratosquilla oratoria]|uniref:uncharacterized protein LOC143018703 n=1 Tax=Oratosquilla oratoria TaxID=337810 RepID=UPI003F759F55
MLSQLASTYDPLGLVLPIIVPAKILFQEATRLKMSWDENIPISLCQKWLKWIASLYEISRLRFPRCVLPLEWNGCTSELHHFCDASEVAFGACTYIRTIDQDGKVHVALLASKARVAPIKGVTIPRLEISAAVEAAKLDVVRRELDIPLLKSNFWSDSTIALAYIQNETRRFKTFVANRVTLIRQVSEANQWHVSGDENPADVLSRGCFVDNLPASWFNGPPFLSNYKCAWPAQDDLVGYLQDEDPEVRREVYPTSIVQTCQSGVTQHPIDTLIEHYSSLYRLKKAVGWWLRLIQFLKKKIPQNSPRAYFHETKNIEAGKTVLKSSSIYKLSPILIDGLLVVGARRGYPSNVWSDNGTNLVGARAELARSVRDLDRSLIVRETRRRDVEWSFNPPSASHHGGVWERMIRSVRKVLFALVIKSPRMTDDVLKTLFCEAESIVNSRPLTKCSDDASDESPLTPNHLLLLQGNSPLSWGAFHDADPYRKHWRHVQHLAKQFWKRWVSEYLVELQRRQKWNSESPNLSVGDLVLIMNENSPRGSWPLGSPGSAGEQGRIGP